MNCLPSGIPVADWLATLASVKTLLLPQQQEIQALRKGNDELRIPITTLASQLASSSKLPSSGRARGLSLRHGVRTVAEGAAASSDIPDQARSRCGTLPWGEDPAPPLGVAISLRALVTIRQRLSAALAEPSVQDLEATRQQLVTDVDEIGAPPATQTPTIPLKSGAAQSPR